MIDTKELRKVTPDCYWPTTPVTINEILDRLEAAESARRDDYQNWMTALDRNAELLAKLEAAEKDAALKERVIDALGSELNAVANEHDALQAKIAEMEKQEPVGVLHVGSYYGEELQDWEFEADQRVCDRLNERHVTNPTSLNLYALPSAQTQGEEK